MNKSLIAAATLGVLVSASAANATVATGVLELGAAGGSCLKVTVGGKTFGLSTYFLPQVARGIWLANLVGQVVKVSTPSEVGSTQETETVPCGVHMDAPQPNAFQILPPGYF